MYIYKLFVKIKKYSLNWAKKYRNEKFINSVSMYIIRYVMKNANKKIQYLVFIKINYFLYTYGKTIIIIIR